MNRTALRAQPETYPVQPKRVVLRLRPGRAFTRIAALVWLLLAISGETAGQANSEEYQVKAAFLFHFAQLVDWPAGSLPANDNSLFLCTLGEDPFAGALETTIVGKPIGNRVLRVRHLRQTEGAQDCQILFLGKAETKRIPALLSSLKPAPVLTVGETSGFLDAGGMICFLLVENRIRFAIDLEAADAAKLKIGSRLLVLAQSVVGEHRDPVK
jgi:YfiR/HmsC-like